MQQDFLENSFKARTQQLYDYECTQIGNASSEGVRNELKLVFGLNQRSPLCQWPNFDVIRQLPQDIMHIISEGVLQYEVRLVILYYIENDFFKLEELNSLIEKHSYGYTEISSKPGPLRQTVFTNKEGYKLKYSAAQAILFLRLLSQTFLC